ncbi:MAG: endopeptidase La [Candidatus Limivicinus sp.]|nr:endopeptidase La [Clostridiales bacterium]MDY6133046.1 endopeptidase La [Candidatus Limivicinus sp.]
MSDTMENEIRTLPMLPLRGLSVFPAMLLTFDVERNASVAALDAAVRGDHLIFLAAQKDVATDVPEEKDIYHVGTVCRVRQQLRQPHSSCRVMVEGLYRAEALSMDTEGKGYSAQVTRLDDKPEKVSAVRREALVRSCLSLFNEYLQMNPDMMNEQLLNILANPDIGYVISYIAQNVHFSLEDKQRLLEEVYPSRRLTLLNKLLNNELDIMAIEKELNDATQEQVNRSQREYYLREEMKIIQAELGDDVQDDIEDYREKINALPVSEEIRTKLLKEVSRLSKQPFGSSEAAVIRGYLDVCLEIPWNQKTQETVDLKKARKILDDDHFGLEKVKERIIEYLAVKKLSPEIKGGLLCLVGPPGTGKTSIAMSIARATNRKLVRISLGGVHDEAEIRGHRKTYIGAMPGRIINGVIQAKSCNPLMVLDEIDKLGSDYRGDPSAALLEALDGEQNGSFRDNFLELPFDLSEIFFITTANTTDTIPRALLDRMEVIELSSYTDEEKLEIAKRHLLPKQRKKHGLRANQLKISDEALRAIISGYTRESGVRLLEREIARVCRKAAAMIAGGECKSLNVKNDKLEAVLGPVKFKPDEQRSQDEVGLVRGLAYTAVGGEVLDVEVSVVDGSGKLELTGNLGDVMKESAHAAVTYIRSRASVLGIDPDFYKNKDIHIHFPEGAVPKDGPSAGITVCIALISALTGTPVRHDVAMTGEITLRGRVLPIGGLREKTMAAYRNGVRTVIIPSENTSDLEEIDQTVRRGLHFVPTDHVDKVLDVALVRESGSPNVTVPPPAVKKELCAVRQ